MVWSGERVRLCRAPRGQGQDLGTGGRCGVSFSKNQKAVALAIV
jgi:hypothetical protein